MTIDTELPIELVVFDFDETVVDCNSDTFINKLAPDGGRIPDEMVDKFLTDRDWTAYMQQVFNYLHQNGVTQDAYKQCLATMPLVDSMKWLFDQLHSTQCKETNKLNKRFDVIIISDANTFFINYSLEVNGMAKTVRKVFTNPAEFDQTGCLNIERYHVQNWCTLSAVNMCKGHILKEFISKRASLDNVHYSRIAYCGDGQNDFCPATKLSANDLIFPRSGFKLHKLLLNDKGTLVKAQMYAFVTAEDIWNVLIR